MHLLIYRRRPGRQRRLPRAPAHRHRLRRRADCRSIRRSSAKWCSRWAAFPSRPMPRPGTPELTDALEPLVQNYDAILMANHGVVTYGQDLLTAFFRMETVEHFAQVSLVTEMLGKQSLAFWRRCGKIARGARPLRHRPRRRRPAPNARSHRTASRPAARQHHARRTRGPDRRSRAQRPRPPLASPRCPSRRRATRRRWGPPLQQGEAGLQSSGKAFVPAAASAAEAMVARMKAARVLQYGSPEVIQITDVPCPEPGNGQVRIRVKAAGVGPWDALIREGRSGIPQTLPLTLGSDLAGIVDESVRMWRDFTSAMKSMVSRTSSSPAAMQTTPWPQQEWSQRNRRS